MKALKAISSLSLILLVLVSSISFKVGMHFCGGAIQSIALYSKAEPCTLEKSLPPCHKHQTPDCCNDETIIHQGDDDQLASSTTTIEAPTSIEVELTYSLIAEIIPAAPTARTQYFNYDPPLRASDLTVEYRVFLI